MLLSVSEISKKRGYFKSNLIHFHLRWSSCSIISREQGTLHSTIVIFEVDCQYGAIKSKGKIKTDHLSKPKKDCHTLTASVLG